MTIITRRRAVVAAVLAALPLASCASVTRGTTDAWVINTEPSGAKVETTNGHQCPATPCAIKMPRKSQFTATVTKDGYKPATVTVIHKTSSAGAAGMAGNVLVGGLIGIGVDSITGATQDLVPNPVSLVLEPVGQVAQKAAVVQTAQAAETTAPAPETATVQALAQPQAQASTSTQ